MKPIDFDLDLDLESGRTRERRLDPPRPKWPTKAELAQAAQLVAAETSEGVGFSPSLKARKAERFWLAEQLGPFHQRHVIADVVERVRSGKEATVYVCTTPPGSAHERIAAKVYHAMSRRTAANKQLYQLGRSVLDGTGRPVAPRDWRLRKAIEQSSGAGRAAAQTSWLMHEFACLRQMYGAGGDVPEPLVHGGHALLMEFVGDASGAAPILANVQLDPELVAPVFGRILENVELLLSLGWVHGDLSAHNILYRQGTPTLIDFPQVVAAQENPQAQALLERDLERVAAYLARFGDLGSSLDARALAEALWTKHVLRAHEQP